MGTFGFSTVGFFRTLREKSPSPRTIHVHENAIRLGVVLSIVATVLVAISNRSTLRRLRRNEALVLDMWPLSITVAMLLAVIGVVSSWMVLGDAPH